MSASASEAPLRWVQYDGVFYAALLVPPAEAPVEVPSGHAFVFFLDGESGAVVPSSDVQPYDPDDKVKAENPAAVAGVALARGLLYGAGNSSVDGATSHSAATTSLPTALEAELEDDGNDENAARRARPTDDVAEDDMNLLDMLTRAERKEKKRQEKKEKREGKKLKSKRTRDVDSDDSGADDALLLPRQRASSGSDSDDDGDGEASNDADERQEGENHWSHLAEDFDLGGEDEYGSGSFTQAGRASRRNGGARAGAGGGGMANALFALSGRGNLVSVYVPQIQHVYRRIQQEAREKGKAVTAFEVDVTRAVEQRLKAVRAQVAMLESEARRPGTSREKKAALAKAVHELQQNGVNVTAIARAVVKLRSPPERRRGAAARALDGASGAPVERHRPLDRSISAFQDPMTALTLRAASARAELRDMATEAGQRYGEQLLHRQQFVEGYRSKAVARASEAGKGLLDDMDVRSGPRASTESAVAPSFLERWHCARESRLLSAATATESGFHGVGAPVPSPPRTQLAPSQANYNDYSLRFMTNTSGTALGLSAPLVDGVADSAGGGGVRAYVTDDALNLYNSANVALRQSRTAAVVPAYYDFGVLSGLSAVSVGGGPALLDRSAGTTADAVGAREQQRQGELAQISPMHLAFDHRAAFAVTSEEADLTHLQAQDPSLMKSSVVSASLHAPSQASLWYSESQSIVPGERGRRHGDGRLSSRASSAASSLAPPDDDEEEQPDGGRADGRSRGAGRTSRTAAPVPDWRSCAKRTIQKQLTLYHRGMKGRPAVLSLDDFRAVGKLLLERCVRNEAKKEGVSMALRSNNTAAEFTADVEASIRRSVDNYVARHFTKSTATSVSHREDAVRPGEVALPQPEPHAPHPTAAVDDVEYES